MTETLLDAFVRVGLDPDSPITGQIGSLLARLNGVFADGGAAAANAFSSGFSRSGGGGGGGRGGGGRGGLNRYLLGLQRQLSLFRRDAALVEIDVSLLGSEDVKRELARIKNLVKAEQEKFRLVEPGRGGDQERIAAIREIVRLRTQELAILRDRAVQESQQRGQPPASVNLVEQLRASSSEASRLKDEIFEIRSLVILAKNPQLAEDFRTARVEANRLRETLSTQIRNRDLVGARETIRRIGLVRSEFGRLRTEAGKSITLNVKGANLASGFKEQAREVRIGLRRDQSLARGGLSATDRAAIVSLNAELDLAEAKFNSLNAVASKTPAILREMTAQTHRFKDAANQIGEIQKKTQGAVTSMNTLNNNMYQAGQAIEDFAVGFELNGLKGGIRGAANNVSFLLNQLALSAAQSGAISDRFRLMIPLAAGIGSAIGIVVIPRLVEWIQSLDEVKIKTQDISRQIDTAFRRKDFEVDLRVNLQEMRSAILEADKLDDALKEITKTQQEADRRKLQVLDAAAVFGNLRGDLANALSELQEVASKGAFDLVREIEKPLEKNPFFFKRFFSQQASLASSFIENIFSGKGISGSLKDFDLQLQDGVNKARKRRDELIDIFSKGAGDVRLALLDIGNQARTGIPDAKSFNVAANNIEKILIQFDKLKAVTDDPETLQPIVGNLESVRDRLRDSAEAGEAFGKIVNEINSSLIQQTTAKATGLTAEYEFLRDVAEGRKTEEERILFVQKQQSEALEKQLDAIEKAAIAQGGNKALVDRLRAESRIQRALENQIDLQTRINEIRQELKDSVEDKVSESLTLDKAAIGVVSGLGDKEEEERKKLQRELELLTNALNDNTQVLRGAGVQGIRASAAEADAVRPQVPRVLTPAEQQELRNQAAAGRRFDASQKRRERAFERDKNRAEIDAAFQNALPFPLTREDQDKKDREDIRRFQQEQAESRERQRGLIEEDKKRREDSNKARADAIKNGLSDADFSSETIEKLIAASNTLLSALNQNVSKLDTSARAA